MSSHHGAASGRQLALACASLALVLAAAVPARAAERPGAPSAAARGPAGVRTGPADPVVQELEELSRELERDRASPRALVPLIRLRALEEDLPELARAAMLYAGVADDAEAHPEVRAYARLRLAALERSRGHLQRSQAELAKLGFLTTWQIAGPFDNEGKRGFDQAFPPELSQDLKSRFPGKAREVGWRSLAPEAQSMGFVHLGAAVRPAREVVVYALSVVDSPRAQRVHLHLGASGALKVFLDGALVHADPAYHPARFDQAGVAVTLHPGPNRLLIKLCHAEGRFGFYARLADPRGAPLQLAAREVPPLPEALPAATERAAPLPSVVAALERRAREAKGAARGQAHEELAIVLAERRPGEDRERRAAAEARRAAELSPRSLSARLLAARLDHDANRRRAHLEAAVEAHPDDARALHALAVHELERGQPVRAKALLERALAAAPGYVAARLTLADVHQQAGLGARARAEREAAAREAPLHAGAVAVAARSLRAGDRLAEAAQLLRKALSLRYDDASTRAALIQLELDRGELDAAVALLDEAVRLEPTDLDARLRLCDLLAANGRRDEAEAGYAEALRIAPEEAEVHERRGQSRLRAGRTGEALQDFQAALELRPQNPRLKELVRAIEPARERFEKPYLYDARELARAAPAASEEDALVLGDLKVTRVFPSGLSSSFRQLVVKVLNQRGADSWRTWATGYSPDRQEVRVERARVVKPDGTAVDSFQESDRSASEPWYRLYYDTRTRQIGLPALAPGDLLEIAVRTADVAGENLLSDYFGELVFLAEGTPKARADYVLLVPEGRRIFSRDPALPGVERRERTLPGGVVEHRWQAHDVPRVRAEPGMPGWSEVAPYVHVSTYQGWDEVARFYWGLVREQLAPTPEIRQLALRLAGEVRAERRARGEPESGDELALVQAVHRFVVTNTRYVGLEFGIHGYKPYRVDQVFDRRFGDCKDKASLTHALLEAAGIDSRLVLLRMRRLGNVPERPASLAIFNHAILYVPRHDLWLDGTAAYSGSRDLPSEDRGASVLVVNPDGPPRFTRIPEGRPEDNATAGAYRVTLAPDGSAAVRGEARAVGTNAPSYRRAYAAEQERRVQLEGAMSRTFPGVTVKEVSVSDLARLEDEVVLRFALELPRLAERDGGGLRFLPFGGGHRYLEALAPLSSRRFDLVLGAPWETRLAYRYQLPQGWGPLQLPPPLRLETPQAVFVAAYRLDGEVLVADARLEVRMGRVAAADYPGFREFLAQVDRALAQPVRVAPGRPAPAPAPAAAPATTPTAAR